jgi:hypothetical protein
MSQSSQFILDHIANFLKFISNTQSFWFTLDTSYNHGCHLANRFRLESNDYEVLLVVAGLASYTRFGFAVKPTAWSRCHHRCHRCHCHRRHRHCFRHCESLLPSPLPLPLPLLSQSSSPSPSHLVDFCLCVTAVIFASAAAAAAAASHHRHLSSGIHM